MPQELLLFSSFSVVCNSGFDIHCFSLRSAHIQVVHAVANEGLRLEIPSGPVGRLIAGTSHI